MFNSMMQLNPYQSLNIKSLVHMNYQIPNTKEFPDYFSNNIFLTKTIDDYQQNTWNNLTHQHDNSTQNYHCIIKSSDKNFPEEIILNKNINKLTIKKFPINFFKTWIKSFENEEHTPFFFFNIREINISTKQKIVFSKKNSIFSIKLFTSKENNIDPSNNFFLILILILLGLKIKNH